MPTAGTALTLSSAVNTTAATHNLGLTSGGVIALGEVMGSGKLTVCLMSNHHDYLGNEPTEGGAYTRIKCHFSEYTGTSRDPQLKWVWSGGSVGDVSAEGSGNDDDGYMGKANLDDSATWAEIRGDETSSADTRLMTSTFGWSAIHARRFSARGAVIRDITRSYFVFDVSGGSVPTGEAIVSGSLHFYLDNLGTSTGDSAEIIAVQATALEGSADDYGNCWVADTVAVTHNATFFGSNF